MDLESGGNAVSADIIAVNHINPSVPRGPVPVQSDIQRKSQLPRGNQWQSNFPQHSYLKMPRGRNKVDSKIS